MKLRLSLIIAALLLLLPVPSIAAGVDLKAIKPLTPIPFAPEAEFEAQTRRVEGIPFGDPALSYELRIPKDWTVEVEPPDQPSESGQISNHILGFVARYVSPPRLSRRSTITVETQNMTYEISARNWFVNQILQKGFTLNALTEMSSREVEAIYIEIVDDTAYAVRVRVIFNGPRAILVRYSVPQEDFQKERTIQAQILASFRPMKPESRGIENRNTHNFLDQSFFDYPASWTLNAPQVLSIERLKALLFTPVEGQKPNGQINLHITSKLLGTTLAEEVQLFKSKMDIPRFKLGKIIETIPLSFDKTISFGAVEVYEMLPQPVTMMHYELAIAVMEGEDYYYIVSLLTPAREEEFYLWSRNMEAFRIIAQSVRRYDWNDPYYQQISEEAEKKTPSP